MQEMVLNAFSIDVEDWFHINGIPNLESMKNWEKFESRVEDNMEKLLNILRKKNVKATCFVLGWIAENHPDLICKIKAEGHEIASHGYSHNLVYKMDPKSFFEDIFYTKKLLEKITDQEVIGYRAPSFSITKDTLWAFDEISKAGYKYDSSIVPTKTFHGGIDKSQINSIHVIETNKDSLVEFPLPILDMPGYNLPLGGGGYLRSYPYWFYKNGLKKINRKNKAVLVYIHPRDIDPQQPRPEMPLFRKFMSYNGLNSCEKKLENLLGDFRFGTIKQVLNNQSIEIRRK